MKISALYNTPIELEEGDLIAIEDSRDNARLYIRNGDNLYVSVGLIDPSNIPQKLNVNSAGYMSEQSKYHPKLVWEEYHPISVDQQK